MRGRADRAFQCIGRTRMMVRTNATPDQNVSNTQKSAICFEIDRINRTRNWVSRLYTEITNERNREYQSWYLPNLTKGRALQ